jgi:HEAT repeat protein
MKGWLLLASALLLGACPGERGALLAALASPDPAVRSKAVENLAARKDHADLGYLIGRVSDPDPVVRASVARGLGAFDDRRATEALALLVSDSSESVQIVAVESLARQKNPRALSYLLLAYQQGGAASRAAIIQALAQGGRLPEEAVRAEARALWSEFSKALSRGNLAERVAAAEGLGRSGRPEAVERLATYLGADSQLLALAASRGLGSSGSPEARAPLEALLNDDSVDLRIAAAEALGMLGDRAAAPALARTAGEGGRPGGAAVDALERLLGAGALDGTDPAVAKHVCEALLVDDEQLAARLAGLAAKGGMHCDVRPLLARIQSNQLSARAALGAVGALTVESSYLPSLAKRISELLRFGLPAVRPAAARTAGLLRLQDVQPALQKVYADEVELLGRNRARWIAPIARPGQAAPPDSLFAEEAPETMALLGEAGLALVRLGGASQLETCKQLAADPAPALREVAAPATLALPPPVGWPILGRLLDDPQLAVHERAVEALASFDVRSPEPTRWLVEALRRGDERVSRSLLIATLAKRPASAETVEVLATELQRPETAGAAAEALGRQDASLAAPIVVARLAELPSAGLIELVTAASTLKLKASVPSLRQLRFHPRPEVAAAAAAALWKLDAEHAQAEMSMLADDYYFEVRKAVAGAPPG